MEAPIKEQKISAPNTNNNAVYDPDKIVIGSSVPADTVAEVTVISVTPGTKKDFVDAEILAQWKDTDPDAPCINVVCEGTHANTTFTVSKLISTYGNHAPPKSIMAKWMTRYTGAPKVGQKVRAKTDTQGYWKIILD